MAHSAANEGAPPKVTVAMPTYNRANVVAESIRGVLNQTFTDFEFLIHDDGSKDPTPEVVRSFDDPRIRFVAAENRGPPHPLAALLARTRGDYLIVMHDHDLFAPDLLAKSVAALEENPGAGFVLQGSAWVGDDGRTGYRDLLLDWPYLNRGPDVLRNLLLRPNRLDSPFHACAMIRMSAFQDVGLYYDIGSGWYADVELTYRLLAKFDFVYLREVLFVFREREHGHVLNQRMWSSLTSTVKIHEAAIRALFTTEAELHNAQAVLRKKTWSNRLRIFVALSAANDRRQLEEGFHHLAEPDAPWWALLARSLAKQTEMLTVGLRLVKILRRIRHLK